MSNSFDRRLGRKDRLVEQTKELVTVFVLVATVYGLCKVLGFWLTELTAILFLIGFAYR